MRRPTLWVANCRMRMKIAVSVLTAWAVAICVSDARASLQTSLRVTEIMYHPAAGNDALEYIELTWGGTSSVDLTGVEFTYGIDFALFGGQTLDPGESIIVVRSISAFESHYGTGFNIAGQYVGGLDNAGERIQLVEFLGEIINDFEFADDWYPETDGGGYSLELRRLDTPSAEMSNRSAWRASSVLGGSPGEFVPATVPEPASVGMWLLLGGLGMCWARRSHRRRGRWQRHAHPPMVETDVMHQD